MMKTFSPMTIKILVKMFLTLLLGGGAATWVSYVDSAPVGQGESAWGPWLVAFVSALAPILRNYWVTRDMPGNPVGWVLRKIRSVIIPNLILPVIISVITAGCVTTKTHVSTTDADGASVEYGWVALSLAGKQDSSGGDITTSISKDGAYKLSAGASATGQDSQVIATIVAQVLAELARAGVFMR